MGHSRPLFIIFVFSIGQLGDKIIMPMSGFELQISGVRSDRFPNLATTTAKQLHSYLLAIKINTKFKLVVPVTTINAFSIEGILTRVLSSTYLTVPPIGQQNLH